MANADNSLSFQEARRFLPPHGGAPVHEEGGRLRGLKALITGGTGLAVAIAFAREGADVVIGHQPQDEGRALEICTRIRMVGRKSAPISGDICEEAFCETLVRRAVSTLGGLDIVVNTAGFLDARGEFDTSRNDPFDKTLKANLYAPFWISKAAAPLMRPGSAIIFTASVGGFSLGDVFIDDRANATVMAAFSGRAVGQLAERGIRVASVSQDGRVAALDTIASRYVAAAERRVSDVGGALGLVTSGRA